MKLGLYCHLPFCVSKCSYCDFFTVIGREDAIPDYVDAICREIELYADRESLVDTVFLGGGTPSLLEPDQLGGILDAVRNHFRLGDNVEVTCETNPETVNLARLKAFRSIGINRLSLGIQSFHLPELVQLTRAHNVQRAVDCIRDAREAGFDNLSIDLISALPGMRLESWMDNLERAVSLEPNHISAYTLEYHPGTKVSREREAGLIQPAQEAMEREMYLKTIEYLEANGFHHYEISNFARPGFECRHNLKYWRHESYLGFGTSSHSFLGHRRWWNHANLDRYLEDLSNGIKPVGGSEELEESQLELERLTLGLRTRQGAEWNEVVLPSGIPGHLIERNGTRIALTSEGFALYDSVCDVFARSV